MWLAITGTPGTGKTAVARLLRDKGLEVVDLNAIVKENDFILEFDDERDTAVADIDSVTRYLEKEHSDEPDILIEGHWSHKVQVTGAVVLRCDPKVLEKRLSDRGYSVAKVRENVEAETIDVTLVEAIEALGQDRVAELDTTNMEIGTIADAIIEIMNGDFNRYKVGSVDWSGHLLE